MPRIVGVDVPNDKKVDIGLTYIYGIGNTTAQLICTEGNISPDTRGRDLTEDEVTRIASAIDKNCMVEGELRRQVSQNIARLREIGCYRGLRHRRGLPCRGQRTKTNARTRKGRKRTVAGKKAAPTK